eukprot:4789240-Amphidinium_carterae.1
MEWVCRVLLRLLCMDPERTTTLYFAKNPPRVWARTLKLKCEVVVVVCGAFHKECHVKVLGHSNF